MEVWDKEEEEAIAAFVATLSEEQLDLLDAISRALSPKVEATDLLDLIRSFGTVIRAANKRKTEAFAATASKAWRDPSKDSDGYVWDGSDEQEILWSVSEVVRVGEGHESID